MLRLQKQDRGTSFYEAFSDLIFGTMAIFVLLLFIFMALASEGQKKSEESARALAESLSSAAAERAAAREQLNQLVEQLAALESAVKAQGLEVAIAVDTSGSMGPALQHLLETITTIATVMPRVAPEVRIGIVGYCRTDANTSGLQTFPMRKIFASAQDGGQSLNQLLEFTRSLQPGSGIAPVAEGVRGAMNMHSQPGAFAGFQILFVLGDTGPFESTANDWTTVEPHELSAASQLVHDVARWTSLSQKRRIVSLFSGAGQVDYQYKHQASREFFSSLASESGQRDNFTENPGKMLAYLLMAIVTER